MTKRTQIVRTKSFFRSYFVPIFTRKQLIFFMVCTGISTLLALDGGTVGLSIAFIVICASMGSLSITAPAVLETSDLQINVIESALQSGGWVKCNDGVWRHQTTGLRSWENDQVQIDRRGDRVSVYGPLFTLRRLREVLRSRH